MVQIPGIAGMENNSILFEFEENNEENIDHILEGCFFAATAELNICILRSSNHHFGYHRKIHIWLTSGDLRNANLMIILAYIIIGPPEWRNCEVQLFAAFPVDELKAQHRRLMELVKQGRLLISRKMSGY